MRDSPKTLSQNSDCILALSEFLLEGMKRKHVEIDLDQDKGAPVAHLPSGLTLRSDYVSAQEEKDLMEFIDSKPWNLQLSRRTQHYGFEYAYSMSSVDHSKRLGDLPPLFVGVLKKIIDSGLINRESNQAIVNGPLPSLLYRISLHYVLEYLPGQGISKHIDKAPLFGDVVISLRRASLLPPCPASHRSVY